MANPWEMPPQSSVMDLREPKPTLGQNPWDMPSAPETAVQRAQRIRERPISDEEFASRYSYPERVEGRARSLARGIPIFGNYVNQTPAARDFARSNPARNTAGQLVAGGAVVMPQSYAVRRGAAAGQNLIRRIFGNRPRTEPGLLMDILSQGGLGGALSYADLVTRRRTNNEPLPTNQESIVSGMVGAGAGMLGPVAGRILAPAGVGSRVRTIDDVVSGNISVPPRVRAMANILASPFFRNNRDPRIQKVTEDFLRRVREHRTRELADITESQLARFGVPAGGALAGLNMGGIEGMIYGGIGSEAARRGLSAYAGTRMGQRHLGTQLTPEAASILNSLPMVTNRQLLGEENEPQIPTLTGR